MRAVALVLIALTLGEGIPMPKNSTTNKPSISTNSQNALFDLDEIMAERIAANDTIGELMRAWTYWTTPISNSEF